MRKVQLVLLFLGIGFSVKAQVVSIDSLMKHVDFFTSDVLKGRMAGTQGYEMAADYCVAYFEQLGLKKINHSSILNYNQSFMVESNEISECSVSVINPDGVKYSLKLGKDFVCRGFTGHGSGLVDLAFCGFGQNKEDYNDYRGVDIAGKAVILFKSNPPFLAPDTGWGDFSIRRQVAVAKEKGAVAVIFVSRPNLAKPQKPIGSTSHGEGVHQGDMPQFQIDISWVDSLLLGTRYPLERLDRLTENLKMPFSLSAKSKIEYKVSAHYNPTAETRNLLAYVEGSDPVLKNEFVVVSAHLDHVGMQQNLIFPGANDNASGSSAVLELARLISNREIKPARSILFVLFSAEEKGIEGSTFMAQNLPLPKEKIAAIYNMDCIAFGDSIQIGNGLSNPNLWDKMKKIDGKSASLMTNQTWAGGGSDLAPFHQIGIPGLYVVTKYSYTHLHLPTDTPQTLNARTYKEAVNLLYQTLITD